MAAAYGAATCLHVDGASLDAAVVDAFFAALAPAELDVLAEVMAAQHADQARLEQHYADEVSRASYAAQLAQRQYQAVDPDNRLVAGTLERNWEEALRGVAAAQQAAERFAAQPPVTPLSPSQLDQFRQLSQSLPVLWHSGQLTPSQQKELLRTLVQRVIVTRPIPDTLQAKVVWVSGAVTPLTLHPPILRQSDMGNYDQLVQQILTLGAQGYSNPAIARRLTEAGFRSARSTHVTPSTVAEIRRDRGQISLTEQFKTQAKVDGQWTIFGLSQVLEVHRNWLYTRIRNGTLPAHRHPILGHYLIPDDPDVLASLRAQRARCCYR